MPASVPRLTWQQVAESVRTFTAENATGAFLVEELCNYLTEEKLMDPPQLTPLHIVALANCNDALRSPGERLRSGHRTDRRDSRLGNRRFRAKPVPRLAIRKMGSLLVARWRW